MEIISSLYGMINELISIAKKRKDADTAQKLSEIYSKVLELQEENRKLSEENEMLKKQKDIENDIEISEQGYIILKSDKKNGKTVKYCMSCYNNTQKLYPIVNGTMARDSFCTNCKMRYGR